jgi:tRNA pseudouridine55 synthase
MDKEYTGTITLGATTPSYDRETPLENEKPFQHITEEMIRHAAETFIGETDQKPPIYSAIKVAGKALYKSARKGQEVEVATRKVVIKTFEIVRLDMSHVHFRIVCSKGTYIRSVAHDMGQLLGCGGYLSGLRRTRVGKYRIEDAWKVEELVERIEHREG